MGTERSLKYQGPCSCGAGTYSVFDCEVDHAWPTATPQWYEQQISCKKCADVYTIDQRGHDFVLIENSQIAERRARADVAAKYAKKICASGDVIGVAKAVEQLLAAQRSIAAAYRLLDAAGLSGYSLGTFRRHWSGEAACVRDLIRPNNLVKLFGLVGAKTDALEADLAELAKLEADARERIVPLGGPIYTLQL